MTGSGGNPDLTVVPDDVTALGKYAYDLAETLRTALADAGRNVTSLTDNGWSSSAATSFAGGWTECQDGGNTIIDALKTMAASLGVTADTYRAQDNQFASRVSSLNLP